MSLLLKQCPLFDEIALYDIAPVCGIGTELGHVDTSCLISAYQGTKSLKDSLKVIIVITYFLKDDLKCDLAKIFSGC